MPKWPQAASGGFSIFFLIFFLLLFHFSKRFEFASLRFVSFCFVAICVDFRNVSSGRFISCFLFSYVIFNFQNASGVAKRGAALGLKEKDKTVLFSLPECQLPLGYATACNINLLICSWYYIWSYMLYGMHIVQLARLSGNCLGVSFEKININYEEKLMAHDSNWLYKCKIEHDKGGEAGQFCPPPLGKLTPASVALCLHFYFQFFWSSLISCWLICVKFCSHFQRLFKSILITINNDERSTFSVNR